MRTIVILATCFTLLAAGGPVEGQERFQTLTEAVIKVRSTVPADARTARSLGTETLPPEEETPEEEEGGRFGILKAPKKAAAATVGGVKKAFSWRPFGGKKKEEDYPSSARN